MGQVDFSFRAKELSSLTLEGLREHAVRARKRLAHSEWELGLCLLVVERRGLHRSMDCSTVPHYAVEHLKLDGQKASELLRTARALEKLPRMDAAYRDGRLCWGKIRELTRVVCVDTEPQWLEFALSHHSNEVQNQVRLNPRAWKLRANARTGGSQLTLTEVIPSDGTEAGETAERGRRDAPDGGPKQGSETVGSGEAAASVDAGPAAPAGRDAPGRREQSSGDGVVDAVPDGAGLPDSRCAADCDGTRGSNTTPTDVPGGTGGDGDAIGGLADTESSRAGDPRGAPLPLPGPRFIRVTLNFTPDEYASWEQVEQLMRSQLRKRARREEAALAMAAAARNSATQRTQARHQVVVHVNPESGEGWYDTDRGLIPARADKVEEAMQDGQILLLTGVDEDRIEDEQIYCSKSKGVTLATLSALYARAGGRCEGCGRRGLLHVHHRRPRSRGGTHELINLQLRCSACHSLTHEKDLRENSSWREARRRKGGKRRPRETFG